MGFTLHKHSFTVLSTASFLRYCFKMVKRNKTLFFSKYLIFLKFDIFKPEFNKILSEHSIFFKKAPSFTKCKMLEVLKIIMMRSFSEICNFTENIIKDAFNTVHCTNHKSNFLNFYRIPYFLPLTHAEKINWKTMAQCVRQCMK